MFDCKGVVFNTVFQSSILYDLLSLTNLLRELCTRSHIGINTRLPFSLHEKRAELDIDVFFSNPQRCSIARALCSKWSFCHQYSVIYSVEQIVHGELCTRSHVRKNTQRIFCIHEKLAGLDKKLAELDVDVFCEPITLFDFKDGWLK